MDDINNIVATNTCTARSGVLLPCAEELAVEICSLVDEVVCTESVEVGYSMRLAVIAMFKALCEGLVAAVTRCKAAQGRLPRALTDRATDIMESLSFTIESELPKRTQIATAKLGRLCRKTLLDEHLNPVADALGLEES